MVSFGTTEKSGRASCVRRRSTCKDWEGEVGGHDHLSLFTFLYIVERRSYGRSRSGDLSVHDYR